MKIEQGSPKRQVKEELARAKEEPMEVKEGFPSIVSDRRTVEKIDRTKLRRPGPYDTPKVKESGLPVHGDRCAVCAGMDG